MKKREIQELKNRPDVELEKMLKENRESLQNLRFNLAAGKLKNIGEIRKVKKTIARLMTFLKGIKKS